MEKASPAYISVCQAVVKYSGVSSDFVGLYLEWRQQGSQIGWLAVLNRQRLLGGKWGFENNLAELMSCILECSSDVPKWNSHILP